MPLQPVALLAAVKIAHSSTLGVELCINTAITCLRQGQACVTHVMVLQGWVKAAWERLQAAAAAEASQQAANMRECTACCPFSFAAVAVAAAAVDVDVLAKVPCTGPECSECCCISLLEDMC
jgi:hypothetical protein